MDHSETPGGRFRHSCARCPGRRQGLCQSVAPQDEAGEERLEAARATLRIYDAGDLVYGQGDPREHVYNLVSGWLAVHRDLADGRRHLVEILRPGAIFGVDAVGGQLNHGVTALSNAAVCPIPWTRFAELRARTPALNERFIELLEETLRHAIETSTVLAQGSARERIGRLLCGLFLAPETDPGVMDGRCFKVPLTQRHIAEATGLTPIHVNRVLRQLREDGVVSLHNGLLEVIDARKLRALAAPLADGDVDVAAPARFDAPAVASQPAPLGLPRLRGGGEPPARCVGA